MLSQIQSIIEEYTTGSQVTIPMTCAVYESIFQRHLRQVKAFKAEMRNEWMAASEAIASKALYATVISLGLLFC